MPPFSQLSRSFFLNSLSSIKFERLNKTILLLKDKQLNQSLFLYLETVRYRKLHQEAKQQLQSKAR